MPKTTTKKKNSKSSISSKISLKSRKGKMLLLTLVMVAVGAGIIIRSFAATQTWVYRADDGVLVFGGSTAYNCAGTRKAFDSQFNTNVILLSCPADPKAPSATAYWTRAVTKGSYISSNMPGYYRFCAYIQGIAPRVQIGIYAVNLGKVQTTTLTNFNRTSSYTYQCSPYIYSNQNTSLEGSAAFNVSKTGMVYATVGAIVLERR